MPYYRKPYTHNERFFFGAPFLGGLLGGLAGGFLGSAAFYPRPYYPYPPYPPYYGPYGYGGYWGPKYY